MVTIGTRFAAERNRLGLTHAEVGNLLGVTAGTVRSWEASKSLMSAAQIAVFTKVGADAQFIVTGFHTPPGHRGGVQGDTLLQGLKLEELRLRLRHLHPVDRRVVLVHLMMDELL